MPSRLKEYLLLLPFLSLILFASFGAEEGHAFYALIALIPVAIAAILINRQVKDRFFLSIAAFVLLIILFPVLLPQESGLTVSGGIDGALLKLNSIQLAALCCTIIYIVIKSTIPEFSLSTPRRVTVLLLGVLSCYFLYRPFAHSETPEAIQVLDYPQESETLVKLLTNYARNHGYSEQLSMNIAYEQADADSVVLYTVTVTESNAREHTFTGALYLKSDSLFLDTTESSQP